MTEMTDIVNMDGEDMSRADALKDISHNNGAALMELDNFVSALTEARSECKQIGEDWDPMNFTPGHVFTNWVDSPVKVAMYRAIVAMAITLATEGGDY